jgi:hypothetical protein
VLRTALPALPLWAVVSGRCPARCRCDSGGWPHDAAHRCSAACLYSTQKKWPGASLEAPPAVVDAVPAVEQVPAEPETVLTTERAFGESEVAPAAE